MLSDCKDKWPASLFYPADFAFVFPTELEEAAYYYPEFRKSEAEVISVFTDTAYVHRAWNDVSAAIKKTPYPLTANPTVDLKAR